MAEQLGGSGAARPRGARMAASRPDILCFSHLRWDFVYQRPQHLIGRFARGQRVFFVEEPIASDGPARLDVSGRPEGVQVAVPRLPPGLDADARDGVQRELLDELIRTRAIGPFVSWYYTPMALGYSRHLEPRATVYDCMDELSLFRGAPAEMVRREAELLRRADVVFTGGRSLYEAKRGRHPAVHLFPSSIDAAHFGSARAVLPEPADQSAIARPRLGYCGVIDERLDYGLIADLAAARPEWQVVMVGPVVKVDFADLPVAPNIHYLGAREYAQLPAYIAGWDVALMPFADNEATRFISPTKTPEYLAAGKPVVSTPVKDVVHPYGTAELVRIAADGPEFVRAVEGALAQDPVTSGWQERVDTFLAGMSWDRTHAEMAARLDAVLASGRGAGPAGAGEGRARHRHAAHAHGALGQEPHHV